MTTIRRTHVKLPNARAYAAFHAIVETQAAMNDDLGRTIQTSRTSRNWKNSVRSHGVAANEAMKLPVTLARPNTAQN